MAYSVCPPLGICAIATHEPPLQLTNQWFEGSISRKFVQHTGTHSRRISTVDEVAMALRATAALQAEISFDWRDCAGIVFISPSFIPATVASKLLPPDRAARERL